MFSISAEELTVFRDQFLYSYASQNDCKAVFQDVQESLDKKKLFFLYDSVADEISDTSGGRKGPPALLVFDLISRCFVQEIPLNLQGTVKFLFGLKCHSSSGGTPLIFITTAENYGQCMIYVWRANIDVQGTYLEGEPRALLSNPISTSGEFIVAVREDAPELILMTAPGLNIMRINCLSDFPAPPASTFSVPGADLSHFYDAFLSRGNIYFVSACPDGHLDNTRVYVLSLDGNKELRTQHCRPDTQCGMPPARKQAAFATTSGFLLLAGGEEDDGNPVTRLKDYWVLNLETYTWMKIPAQMPEPLIEPRLKVNNSENVYLWGAWVFMKPGRTQDWQYLMLRLKLMNMNPPTYEEALTAPMPSLNSLTTPSLALVPSGSQTCFGQQLRSAASSFYDLPPHDIGIPQQLQQPQPEETRYVAPGFNTKCLIGLAFRNMGKQLKTHEIREFLSSAFPYFANKPPRTLNSALTSDFKFKDGYWLEPEKKAKEKLDSDIEHVFRTSTTLKQSVENPESLERIRNGKYLPNRL